MVVFYSLNRGPHDLSSKTGFLRLGSKHGLGFGRGEAVRALARGSTSGVQSRQYLTRWGVVDRSYQLVSPSDLLIYVN